MTPAEPVWINRKKVFLVGFSVVFAPIFLIGVAAVCYQAFTGRLYVALEIVGFMIVWMGIAAATGLVVLGLVLGALYWRHILQFLGRWFTT